MSEVDQAINAVEYDRVFKSYESFKAVDDVSFTVADGEFTTLLGPSGSGKTTLLSMAAGAVTPDRGRIVFKGRDVTHVAPHKRNTGMVFQRYTLFPNKTVAENIAFPLEVRKFDRQTIAEKVKQALKLVELTAQAERYPSEISGGQAQRVAVARALVFEPALLLMDEPLGALDKSLRELLQTEIRRIQRLTRVPTLYVTHDQDEAMNMSDRIIIMRDGKIAANGHPKQLYERPNSLWTAQFLGEVNAIPVMASGQGNEVTLANGVRSSVSFRAENGGNRPLVAIVRPERCRFVRRAVDRPAIEATISNVTYLGSRQRIDFETASGLALRAMVAGTEDAGVVGERVSFTWDADALLLVADDTVAPARAGAA